MPGVRSGEVQVGFFHQPIGRRFEASGHRCWLTLVDDSMTELSMSWILDQGCPLARKANFWPDPTPFQRFQVNWITESIWISHDLFAWIYCWKTVWQQVGIHEHPKVPARETWSVSRHLIVSVCFYFFIFSNILNIKISYFLKLTVQRHAMCQAECRLTAYCQWRSSTVRAIVPASSVHNNIPCLPINKNTWTHVSTEQIAATVWFLPKCHGLF